MLQCTPQFFFSFFALFIITRKKVTPQIGVGIVKLKTIPVLFDSDETIPILNDSDSISFNIFELQ